MSCIFCKIVSGEISSEILYEDDEVIAFNDINPQAPVHVLLVSKKHIPNLSSIDDSDDKLANSMLAAAKKIAEMNNIAESGFRYIINCNEDGGQEVPHLHAHVIGGKKLGKMC
ncbi:histidine triad nucleotide-binding protein [Thermodesulfobacteriota bacterium]